MKTTKKALYLSMSILLAAAMLCACGAPVQESAAGAIQWTIAVEGADKTEFTSVDYAALPSVTIDVVKTSKNGETNETWQGVLLKDIMDALGISDYTSLTLTASDDYSKDFTPDIVNDEKTILGTVVNGEALTAEDGYVQIVAGNQPGNMWIQSLASIKVNE